MKVKDCMCYEVAYLTPESTVEDCAKLMCNKHVGCIPVCDNNKTVVGLVTDRDVILRSIACNKDIKTTPISDIIRFLLIFFIIAPQFPRVEYTII